MKKSGTKVLAFSLFLSLSLGEIITAKCYFFLLLRAIRHRDLSFAMRNVVH